MHSVVRPNAWVVLRLASDKLKIEQMVPDTTISTGRYGDFQTNSVIGRPYHLTYEMQGQRHGKPSTLRIVPTSELYVDVFAEEEAAEKGVTDDNIIIGEDGVEFELVGENGEVVMRSNREIIDEAATQTLTMEEIIALKRDGADAGKDLIAKLMLSHTNLDKKSSFSLAKYKLTKTKKFLRWFSILPMDVSVLKQYINASDSASKILEIREELLALLGCWGNVHYSLPLPLSLETGIGQSQPSGRWLVVDDAAGLLVAAMADRMGILYPEQDDDERSEDDQEDIDTSHAQQNGNPKNHRTKHRPPRDRSPFYATSNTLTLIHNHIQPNVSLLKYFSFSIDSPDPSHPLTTHLKPISWLQLLSPEDDIAYSTPPPSETPETLASWKSPKRGNYYRKRRRYFRTREIVDETRAGGFDGLVVMSSMDLVGIMQACVPLLRGGAQVAIYSPHVEPLTRLSDLYSKDRRTVFLRAPPAGVDDLVNWKGNEDFPVNPTLLLGVDVQSSRVRPWQVLPGRTHPLMMGKGGAEGYLLTATRVLPVEGTVAGRGAFTHKRRKIGVDESGGVSGVATPLTNDSEAVVDAPGSGK